MSNAGWEAVTAERIAQSAALYTDNLGWSVLPTWGVGLDGVCLCGDPHSSDYNNIGKHPFRGIGMNSSTSSYAVAEEWFTDSTDPRGIGIHCAASDLLIVDIDPRNDGYRGLAALEADIGKLPATVEALTGRYIDSTGRVQRGKHLFFRMPEGFVGKIAGKLPQYKGIDFKYKGYVQVAPSRHVSGVVYEWVDGHGPLSPGFDMSFIPQKLLDLISSSGGTRIAKDGATVGTTSGGVYVPAEDPDGTSTENAKRLIRQVMDEGKPLVRGMGETHDNLLDVTWYKAREMKVWKTRSSNPAISQEEKDRIDRDFKRFMSDFLSRAFPGGHENMDEIRNIISSAIAKIVPTQEEAAGAFIAKDDKIQEWVRGYTEVNSSEVLEGETHITTGESLDSETTHPSKTSESVKLPAAPSLSGSDGEDGEDGLAGMGAVAFDGIHDLTDHGNALRFAEKFARELRYSKAYGWMQWSGRCWSPLKEGRPLIQARVIAKTVLEDEAIMVEDSGEPGCESVAVEIRKWSHASQNLTRLAAMVDLASTDARMFVPNDGVWDRDPWLLNFENGTLDLRASSGLKFRKAMPEDMLTRVVRCEWKGVEEKCPAWDKFLLRVQPEEDMRAFLQRAVGYTLTGIIREKAFFVLHGSGNNGKSVFTENLLDILGGGERGIAGGMNDPETSDGYGLTTAAETLMEKKGGGIPNDVAALRSARYVLASEGESGQHLAVGFIKRVTGGDTLTARFMRKEFFSFKPSFKFWFPTNDVPIINDLGDAIWNRVKLIPWEVIVPKEEQTSRDEMDAELQAEASGIIAWAVRGCLEWQEIGLAEPAGLTAAVNDERSSQDWFEEWFEECIEVGGTSDSIPASDLYQSYAMWSAMRGEKTTRSPQALGRSLAARKKGIVTKEKTTGGSRVWRGIRLKGSISSSL